MTNCLSIRADEKTPKSTGHVGRKWKRVKSCINVLIDIINGLQGSVKPNRPQSIFMKDNRTTSAQ